jgi:hypothetical protein
VGIQGKASARVTMNTLLAALPLAGSVGKKEGPSGVAV